jgi:ligand-binding sensor domain-containing protein/uncharacterized membrane-anchored protein YhcB (DUF1043 family)
MKLFAIKALLYFLTTSNALSQTFHKSYTIPAETVTTQVNCLYQLKNGYIIVGASTGLYKFDGKNFQRFENEALLYNVTAICETKNGKIWLGFSDGKLGWLQNNKVVLQKAEEGFPNKPIKKIIEDAAGIIWIATAGEGLYYFTKNRFYNINTDDGLTDKYVYDLELWNNSVAVATDRGINFCKLINGKKQVSSVTSSKGKIPDNIVRCISSNNSVIALGMQDGGIGFLNLNVQFTNLAKWTYDTPSDLFFDKSSVWVATETSGLLKIEYPSGLITKQFPGKTSCILKDQEGNIWVGAGDQIIRTNDTKLEPLIKLSDGEAGNLHTLLIDHNKHIWYNISAGLKHIIRDSSGKQIEKLYKLPVSTNAQITALYEDKNDNIWIGTMGNGAFLLDKQKGIFRKITEDNTLVNSSILSINGKGDAVWITSLEGAVKATLTDENKNINEHLQFDKFTNLKGIRTNYIYSIFVDSKNRTWFATDGKGITVYDNGKIINYTKNDGLKSEVVYQVTEDLKGNIWFITFNAGLVKFDGKKFTHFGLTEGLSDINITSLAHDKKGNLYLAHKNGVDVLNTSNNTFSYLNDQQGITNINTDLNAVATDVGGGIYFIGDNAIYRYNSEVEVGQPKIIIDHIQLYLNDVAVQQHQTFSYDENNISFYYTGLSYSQSDKLQYQYKLEGYGPNWINTSDRRQDFPKLPPGTYTFRVRVSLNKNFENAPEATFTFTIQKPIWMRWWFIGCTALLIIATLYWFIKDREARLQKWERLEKEKIKSQFETLRNQVNPHFLFNSFNTLVSEIEEDPKRAVQYVEHMADFFRNIVTYREKDVISLKEEISIIKDYLFIQEKRYGCAFKTNIVVSEKEQEKYFLAPLTLQLLAENAIKHNSILKEKPLLLEVFVEADQLIVRNNINPKMHPEQSSGLGLQNIKKRYELLTKKSVVISNDNEYYTVIIPLILNTDGKSINN